MDWQAQFFIYCERGTDPSFWAEPLNALSNAAFVLAALVAYWNFRRLHRQGAIECTLIVLVGIIGIGSFLFHTTATRWAVLADTMPIGIFMLAYVLYTARHLLKVTMSVVIAAGGVFAATIWAASQIPCPPELLPLTIAAGRGCFNGSNTYMPALLALLICYAALAVKKHPSRLKILAASATLAVSIVVRTVDLELCAATDVAGRALGTHFLWHLLNAVTLYLLLAVAVQNAAPGCASEPNHS